MQTYDTNKHTEKEQTGRGRERKKDNTKERREREGNNVKNIFFYIYS